MAKPSRAKSSSESLSDGSDDERANDQVNEEEDEEELEAVEEEEEDANDEATAAGDKEVEEENAAANEIGKREKARLKDMQKLKKQKIQDILDAQNAAIDADMNNKGKGRLKYLLQQTEIFSHFASGDQSSSQKTKGRGRHASRVTEEEEDEEYLKEEEDGLGNTRLVAQPSSLDKIKKPLYEKHPMAKFSWTVTEETDTVEWYKRCLDVLNNVENLSQGKDAATIIQSKVMQFLKGKNEDLRILFDKELKSGDFSGLHAECLTDTWIGNHRWAFIDLSAGPFTWGPAVGGEGVRTELSLPSVEKTLGAVAEISEEEADDILQEAIQEKFAVFGDMQKDHQAIDILLAEIDIYELFAFKHCKGRRVKLALCEGMGRNFITRAGAGAGMGSGVGCVVVAEGGVDVAPPGDVDVALPGDVVVAPPGDVVVDYFLEGLPIKTVRCSQCPRDRACYFTISSVSGELRYTDALALVHTLEDASKGFAEYVNATLARLHPIHCTRNRKVDVEFDMTTIPAFLVVVSILWFVLRPRRQKPKIN